MIDSGEELSVFGDGTSKRDYTYVDDIITGIVKTLTFESQGFEIFNLGDSHPVALEYLIRLIEEAMGKKARIKSLPVQLGDVTITWAAISKAKNILGYQPTVTIEKGIPLFIQWYLENKGIVV
jgi:UDP-glucuronate 4-epimerase